MSGIKHGAGIIHAVNILALVLFLTACTTYTKVSSEEVKSFRQNVERDFPAIQKTEIRYSTPRVEVAYTVKTEPDEKEIYRLFTQTTAFMTSPSFQSEIIDTQYREKYPSWGDPELAMTVTLRGKDISVYQFTCKPEKSESDPNNVIYDQWYILTPDDPAGKPYPVSGTEDGK
ncbi:hypothetical protein [Paenibacillus sp. BIC5C1]|uniref:hypothetical protein n=1 Tax=Paenibacillus sp. BIC5C1 TaxID=3078263 RepID=UPI0028E98A4C|nr:hypothetical protein [Paenibacillus sp. BIC5C1]